MKQSIYVISALFFLAFFTSCEKFELEDHCPEEEEYGAIENPQDLRVSDDSDSEESGDSVNAKAFADDSGADDGLRNAVGDPDDDGEDDSDDELINDDSDDEDEGEQSHRPGGGSDHGGNSKK